MKVVNNAAMAKVYESFTARYTQYAGKVYDLPTYFRAMNELREQGVSMPGEFWRIPADEPLFEIDADTRTITVPAVFAKNGVAVQGDHVAEILYFKIDRFFDAMDLYECNIRIQWESKEGSGVSSVFTTETEEELDEDGNVVSNYLIFGWPLTSAAVGSAGTLRFSVRFYKTDDEGTIIYSLSTKDASCTVQSALSLNQVDMENPEDVSDIIQSRALYGGIISTSKGSLAHITTDIDVNGSVLDLGEDGTLALSVEAVSPDGDDGKLSYAWTRNGYIEDLTATNSTYTATAAGVYQVKVGNENTANDNGVRWIESNIVTVPSASQVAINSVNMPEFAYSAATGADHTVLEVVADNADGAVTYQWYNAVDNSEIANATAVTFDPVAYSLAGVTGSYYCVATNTRNKTTTTAQSDTSILHRLPVAPTSVSISLDEDRGVLVATATPASDLYNYKWYSFKHGERAAASNEYTLPKTEDDTFTCVVTEVVTYKDIDSLRRESDAVSAQYKFTLES